MLTVLIRNESSVYVTYRRNNFVHTSVSQFMTVETAGSGPLKLRIANSQKLFGSNVFLAFRSETIAATFSSQHSSSHLLWWITWVWHYMRSIIRQITWSYYCQKKGKKSDRMWFTEIQIPFIEISKGRT